MVAGASKRLIATCTLLADPLGGYCCVISQEYSGALTDECPMLFFARRRTAIALLAAAVIMAFAVSSAQAQTYYQHRLPNGDLQTFGTDGSGAYSQHLSDGSYQTQVTPGWNPQGTQLPTQQQLYNRGCAGRC